MTLLSRRNFLKTSSLWLAGLATEKKSVAETAIGSILPRNFIIGGIRLSLLGLIDKFGIFSMDNGEVVSFPAVGDVHSMIQNPAKATQFAAFPKFQPFASVLDWTFSSTPRPVRAISHHQFSGHGCFSSDGAFLFTSQVDLFSNQGSIVVYDTEQFAVREVYDSHGHGPHEVRFVEGSDALAIANGAGKSNFAFLHSASGKLLEKHLCPAADQDIRHFLLDRKGNFFLLGCAKQADGEAKLMWGNQNRKQISVLKVPFDDWASAHFSRSPLRPYPQIGGSTSGTQKSKKGRVTQYLSGALEEKSQILGITGMGGNFVTFWNMGTGEFIKKISISLPMGITLTEDKKFFVVNDVRGVLSFIHSVELKVEEDKTVYTGLINNSHIGMGKGNLTATSA